MQFFKSEPYAGVRAHKNDDNEERRDDLSDHGGYLHAGNAEIEDQDEDEVEYDVDKRRNNEEDEGALRVAYCA